ncbi:hypothetical protein MtrunA17_Chr2g0294541 [Medicago truncatula]|uniref:Transmembrane protein, putative n=1 Tax=Medicago truncatula TaxID=3880 RepID=G7IFZ5_MEDTR|nr:transmembrane protein, putative [Medicago truncatula]RHN73071.1 hypothetical protein MtrunA17_Chr2g0294541 [Medicago truncatula]
MVLQIHLTTMATGTKISPVPKSMPVQIPVTVTNTAPPIVMVAALLITRVILSMVMAMEGLLMVTLMPPQRTTTISYNICIIILFICYMQYDLVCFTKNNEIGAICSSKSVFMV